MTLHEKMKKVFPRHRIEKEGEDFLLSEFLRISVKRIKIHSIKGEMEVPAYELTLDNGDGPEELKTSRLLDEVLIEAARFLAGWEMQNTLANLSHDEFAEQLKEEGLITA